MPPPRRIFWHTVRRAPERRPAVAEAAPAGVALRDESRHAAAA